MIWCRIVALSSIRYTAASMISLAGIPATFAGMTGVGVWITSVPSWLRSVCTTCPAPKVPMIGWMLSLTPFGCFGAPVNVCLVCR